MKYLKILCYEKKNKKKSIINYKLFHFIKIPMHLLLPKVDESIVYGIILFGHFTPSSETNTLFFRLVGSFCENNYDAMLFMLP